MTANPSSIHNKEIHLFSQQQHSKGCGYCHKLGLNGLLRIAYLNHKILRGCFPISAGRSSEQFYWTKYKKQSFNNTSLISHFVSLTITFLYPGPNIQRVMTASVPMEPSPVLIGHLNVHSLWKIMTTANMVLDKSTFQEAYPQMSWGNSLQLSLSKTRAC